MRRTGRSRGSSPSRSRGSSPVRMGARPASPRGWRPRSRSPSPSWRPRSRSSSPRWRPRPRYRPSVYHRPGGYRPGPRHYARYRYPYYYYEQVYYAQPNVVTSPYYYYYGTPPYYYDYYGDTAAPDAVQVSNVEPENLERWEASPHTRVHTSATDDAPPLYLRCRDGRPMVVADASVATRQAPVTRVDDTYYQCR